MDRITMKQLEYLVDQINKATNSPLEPWTRQPDGTIKANIGNYHLSGAYGGYCLHRMHNDAGGVTTPLVYGHVPKRELYGKMRAFLDGINVASESKPA